MNNFADKLTPSITTMIRMDHTHVMAAFHRYKADTASARKQAIAEHICLALTVHAQLEEEIFYPALQRVLSGDEVLDKSEPEHDEMRGYIAKRLAVSQTAAPPIRIASPPVCVPRHAGKVDSTRDR